MSREGWNFWPGLEPSLTWKPTTDSSSVKSGREFFNLSEHFGLKKGRTQASKTFRPNSLETVLEDGRGPARDFLRPCWSCASLATKRKVSQWVDQPVPLLLPNTDYQRERKWPFYLFRLSGELQQEVKSVRTVKSVRNRREVEAEKPLFSFLFKINFIKSCSVCGKPGWRIEFEPQPTISTRSA